VVSKPTGRPVGRPRKPRSPLPSREQKLAQKFLRDGDRYADALLDAKLALEMGSERACAMGIAATEVGVEGNPQRVSGDGRVITNWELGRTIRGAKAGTLEGRASTLRVKQGRVHSAEEGRWRTAMASAFMLVLGARRDSEAVRSAIVARAESVGEGEFARWFMLPMLAAKFSSSPSPEFPSNFVSTNEVE
jgi:hypothetical protein